MLDNTSPDSGSALGVGDPRIPRLSCWSHERFSVRPSFRLIGVLSAVVGGACGWSLVLVL